MPAVRWLLPAAAVLYCNTFCAQAGSKDVITHIQCAVCKHAVKEAALRAKDKAIEDEDAIDVLIDNLCLAGKDEGKWTTEFDIIKEKDRPQLSLDRRSGEGACKKECKDVQKACSVALKGKEDSLASYIKDGAGVGKLQREVCKQPCKKAVPELKDWKDETWMPAKPPGSGTTPPPPAEVKANEHNNFVSEHNNFGKANFTAAMPGLLQSAVTELGGTATIEDIQTCFTGSIASSSTADFDTAFKKSVKKVLSKQRSSVRSGLAGMSAAVSGLAGMALILCGGQSQTFMMMKAIGEKIVEYCRDSDESVVEYKPMELLKVKGHDIHKLFNALLSAWNEDLSDGQAFGAALGKLLKEFAHDIEDKTAKTEL